MSNALLAFLVILVLAFGFFMWKSRDTWRWFHITTASFALLLGIVLLFPTAGTLKSRSAWHKVKEDLETQLARLESEQFTLKHGEPPDSPEGNGALVLKERLNRFSLEAGRRWQNLRAQAGASPTSVTLVRSAPPADLPPGMEAAEPPADPAAAPVAAGAAGNLPLIPQGLVVYGFAETPVEGISVPVPTFYLGEFRVTASTPTQVTVEATAVLETPQIQAITSGQASSWSLYELLPLDSHEIFLRPQTAVSDNAIFGDVDNDLVRGSLSRGVTEATIEKYLRDGTPSSPDDPPSTRWVKIEFTKPHSIVVDSPEQRGALDGGFFDASGQAVDSRVQRRGEGPSGGAVRFEVGAQIVVLEEAANDLIEQNVAKLLNTYYVRPLNDYLFVLRRIRLRLNELEIRKTELEFEQKVLEDAIAATVSMLATNQESKLNLEKDLAQLKVEQAAISQYNSTVKETLTTTRQRLSGLYQDNVRLRNELGEFHSAIEESVR
ncbi:MAG TPA: hypothetical protein DDZ51_08320 [Planctomycetaceae bacterium]|nr:hypothetical protein [Planctomycetaceae bacterium]